MQNFLRLSGCLLLAVTLVGCGGGPRLNKVSGTVKYKGEPLKRVLLHFVPTGERPGQAITDETGFFSEVMYDENRRGLVSGEYDVVISWIPKDDGPPTPEQILNPPKPPAELQPVLKKYGNHLEPAIKVKIEDGQRTLDLDLD